MTNTHNPRPTTPRMPPPVLEDAVAPLARDLQIVRAWIERREARPSAVAAPVLSPGVDRGPRRLPASPSERGVPARGADAPSEQELRAFDGGRRHRRAVAALGVTLVLAFGSLLGAMAWSYV